MAMSEGRMGRLARGLESLGQDFRLAFREALARDRFMVIRYVSP